MKKIQTFFNSKLSVQLSILISQILPPRLGTGFSKLTARILTLFKNSDLVTNIAANQQVIHHQQLSPAKQLQKVRQVLEHAGQCYYDLYHHYRDPDSVCRMVPFSESMEKFINYCRGNQGTVVVAPHLSNFDLVVYRLILAGLEAKILTYANPTGGYRIQNHIRSEMGMNLSPMNDPELADEIIPYLKSGGVVATGIDRPLPDRKKRNQLSFFGHPSSLPVGHITLALAADVPITVVSAIMKPDGKYGFLQSGPISLKSFPNRRERITKNAEMIFEIVADYISRAPEQWLMFYPVWPELQETSL